MKALTLTEAPSALRAREAITIIVSSLALAISARLVIYFSFSPVPISLHDSVAVFLGIVLGPRRAALAIVLYLLEGVAGLPVFAAGGAGPLYLMGPTGGYLLGFVPAAVLAGGLARMDHHPIRQFLAMLAGGAVVFICGIAHLAHFVGWDNVFAFGLLPFIPGNLFKAFMLSYGGASLFAGIQKLRS
jgi:biotin transport system substrate-specific component